MLTISSVLKCSTRILSVAAFLFLIGAGSVEAGDDSAAKTLTYSNDVAPILFKKCAECHRPGEAGAMSLLSYEETRPWVKSIKRAVVSRQMPPWHADPRYGKFVNDISLSDAEIETISSWVDQGSLLGDAASVPPAPKFTDDWKLGKPDYIVELPEYTVKATGPDEFPNLSAKLDLPADTWVQSLEFMPGNKKVVHHIVLYRGEGGMTGGAGGQDGVGGGAFSGWAVGTPPVTWPLGMGHQIKKDDMVTANMHYHPSGEPEKDRTRVGLYFGKGEIKKIMSAGAPLRLDFMIPPGEANFESTGSFNVDQDIYVTQYFPHMHQRGKDMLYTAIFPDGRKEILLSVPKYDFNWQWNYYLKEPLLLPKGSRVEILAHHDNSAKNPNNPDPTKALWFGEESNNEMMIGAFAFYVAEGIRPKQFNMNAAIDRYVEENASDTLYRLHVALGGIPLPMALDLPRAGKGSVRAALPGQIISMLPVDVEWTGNDYRMRIPFGEIGSITFSGKAKDDGSIIGKIERNNVFGERGSRENQTVPFIGLKKGAKPGKTVSAK